MSADVIRRAAALLRETAEGTSPPPWCFNSYSVVLCGPKMRTADEWQGIQFAAGHTLERHGGCPACDGKTCQLYTEDYRRGPVVAKVPSHHGDTAIEHAAKDAALIELMHPPVALALAELLDAEAALWRPNTIPANETGARRLTALAAMGRAILREPEDGTS